MIFEMIIPERLNFEQQAQHLYIIIYVLKCKYVFTKYSVFKPFAQILEKYSIIL